MFGKFFSRPCPPKQSAHMTTIKIYAIATVSLTSLSRALHNRRYEYEGSNAPYNEGPVWTLTMIKTRPVDRYYLKQITEP